MEAWGLLFAEKLSYEEVWGKRPEGLSRLEVIEITVAYEEWDLFRKAAEKWEKSEDQRQGILFDAAGYIAKRREVILQEG